MQRLTRFLFVLLFAGASVGAAQAADPFAGALYCCVDANGQKACGDTLPRVCYGRGYQMIDSRGVVVREIAPPLSAEERAAREREKRLQMEQVSKQKEVDRKNRALLSTYNSEREIDQMRERAESDIQTSIQDSQHKIEEAEKTMKVLNEQLGTDPAKVDKDAPPPQDVKRKIRDLQAEVKLNKDLITTKRKDLDAVRTQYDDLKVRYRELSRERASASSSSAPGGNR